MLQEAILLDPSCSGSGIVERGEAHSAAQGGFSPSSRLASLAAMQLRLLSHALTFPSLTTLVYSTCSVHPIENEVVVAALLASPRAKEGGWRLASPPALEGWACRGVPLQGCLGEEQSSKLIRAGPFLQTNGFFVARFERQVKREAK